MSGHAPKPPKPDLPSSGFSAVLRIRDVAVLWSAEALSIAGDQLARVALAVLVFRDTGSAPATAAAYAATLLPAVAGGFLLARIGDRLSRKWVMVACDLVRAVCFAAMSLSQVPLTAVVLLVVLAVFFGPVFSAAQVAHLAARLTGEEYRATSALRLITSQVAQVAGFAFGGALVAVLAPRGALLADAATFLLSALLITALLSTPARRPRPAPVGAPVVAASDRRRISRDPRLRGLLVLTAGVGFFVVPEALAVPYGARIGASTAVVGLLFAAGPLGGAIGATLLVRRVPPERREVVACWMALASGVPLVVSGLLPYWPVAVVAWVLAGGLAAYVVETVTVLVRAAPDDERSHVSGVVSSVMLFAQGAAFLVFGGVAAATSAPRAIAGAGAAGLVLVLVLLVGPLRPSRVASTAHRPKHRSVPLRNEG